MRMKTPCRLPEISWLRDRGVNIWYDEGITPGEDFPERLGKSILNASLVLFYVSPRSVESRHCRNEVFFSLDRDTPVLTIHPEKTELPPGLALSTGTAQAIMRHEIADPIPRKLLTSIGSIDRHNGSNRTGFAARRHPGCVCGHWCGLASQ